MNESAYNGQTIVYVDHMRLQHEGVIVGEDEAGDFVYVQSTMPGVRAAPSGWHFKVARDMVPGLIVQ